LKSKKEKVQNAVKWSLMGNHGEDSKKQNADRKVANKNYAREISDGNRTLLEIGVESTHGLILVNKCVYILSMP
jgi:hypothetical protein